MKPHPRIRKTIKWGGAAVTVLLVAVWIASTWLEFGYRRAVGLSVFVSDGCVVFERTRVPTRTRPLVYPLPLVRPSEGWYLQSRHRLPRELAGHFGIISNNGEWSAESLLGWAFLTGLSSAAALWGMDTLLRRRAKRLNLCPKCSYDRAGIAADAKCPECGAMPGRS